MVNVVTCIKMSSSVLTPSMYSASLTTNAIVYLGSCLNPMIYTLGKLYKMYFSCKKNIYYFIYYIFHSVRRDMRKCLFRKIRSIPYIFQKNLFYTTAAASIEIRVWNDIKNHNFKLSIEISNHIRDYKYCNKYSQSESRNS